MPSFSIAESIVNLLNYVTHREDQDRHIPQKINEFASLAKPRFPPNCIEDSFKAIRSTVRSPEMYSKSICSVVLGQLKSFRNYKGFSIIVPKFLAAI